MGNYRKKLVAIQAFKLGVDGIPDWFMDAVAKNNVILRGEHKGETSADIETLEGWHHANYGDYIIRGVKGELYPCKPDIFDMTYEAVNGKQTNADRIRAMSDEELEKFFHNFNICDIRTNDECKMSYCACCEVCMLDWLKQPAEEALRRLEALKK